LRIVVLTNYSPSIMSFRGALLAELAAAGHEVTVCAPGEDAEVIRQVKVIGVRYRAIALARTGLNPLRDSATFVQLFRLFRELQPDIVLNYTIKPVIYGTLAAKIAGVRSVYSIMTGLGFAFTGLGLNRRLVRAIVCLLYRIVLPRNEVVFFLNSDDLALFRELGLVKGKQRTVLLPGEGIPLEQFPVAPLGTEPVFLLIARLLRDKGIREYVDAARLLRQSYPRLICRIVGPLDSNPTAFRIDEVEAWQREGIIEYMGETDDVRSHIAAASVYVLPSYREGMPRTILEAMAMGRPVVTTDVPGCRETVIDGENGFLVPVGDSVALAAAMERFIRQPEIIVAMGTRSRAIIEEKFDVCKVNAVIMQTLGLTSEKGL